MSYIKDDIALMRLAEIGGRYDALAAHADKLAPVRTLPPVPSPESRPADTK
jgi:hypothetical protein